MGSFFNELKLNLHDLINLSSLINREFEPLYILSLNSNKNKIFLSKKNEDMQKKQP